MTIKPLSRSEVNQKSVRFFTREILSPPAGLNGPASRYDPEIGKAIVGISGVAAAAFVIWLTVRIVNRRERWAKWTAVALSVPLVLYPLSAGPMCWIIHHCDLSKPNLRFVWKIYVPLGFVVENLPEPLKNLESAYEEFFIDFGSPSHIRWAPVNPPAPTPGAPSESN